MVDNLNALIQGGAVGIAILIAILSFQDRKSFLRFIEEQEKRFKNTIDNHLKEHSQSNKELAAAVKELLDFLKWQNKNNGKNEKKDTS
jgi:hypothetical protein